MQILWEGLEDNVPPWERSFHEESEICEYRIVQMSSQMSDSLLITFHNCFGDSDIVRMFYVF